ncbi:MAG: permease [Sphingomonas bacterium]|uniref:DMT family transporter n=1 Tax=Sphingomonas bacterium TaxID=1895847 RepID=UPI00260CBCA6|nr:DMT family transporter [Sphingomonas bacterium]MDB5695129.1 permease [Sphingomonas bacterium]
MNDDRLFSAIALRLLAVALFAGMTVCVKLAEQGGASLGEILFYRQSGAALLVTGVIAAGPGVASLRSRRMGAHLLRAVVGLITMGFGFSAVLALPLAEVTTIGFSMPIFATVLGALILKEPTGWRRWVAVLTGFAGVVIVAQPGANAIPLGGATLGVLAAAGTACVSIMLRQIGRTESALTTVFWFSTLSLLPLGIIYAASAQGHEPHVWLMLGAIGLLGGAAQLAMTASLARGPVSVVVPMDYTSLIWATLFGWLVFGTLPVPATWIGAPIIVGSGLFIVWREHVRRRDATTRAIAEGIG